MSTQDSPFDPSRVTDIVPIIHSDLQHIRWNRVNALGSK